MSGDTQLSWWKHLDPVQVRAAMDEACEDCYDEEEQCSGLHGMIEGELQFPFTVQLLGLSMPAVAFDYAQDDRRSLDLIIEKDGEQYRIEARSVEVEMPLPAGHLYLAAYLYWKSTL